MYAHERSLVKRLADKPFALIGVNTDGDLQEIRKIVEEKRLIWRSFFDGSSGPISESYEIMAYPTVFLIDHEGVIRYKDPRDHKLDQLIDELVAKASGT